MASKNTIETILTLTDKASKGIEQAEDSLDGLGGAADLLQAAMASAAIAGIAKVTVELAHLGAESLRTKNAFENISGGASDAEMNLEAMQRATRGAVSDMDAMAAANQLMQMGLATNSTELETLTRMAVRLGTAMGRDATQSMEEFSLLLANQSIPRLDTFGISASAVRKRIIELQTANEGMTRETAFMIATMEEGELAMDRLGAEVEDELLAFERFEAQTENLKVALGEQLAPAITGVLSDGLALMSMYTDFEGVLATHEGDVRLTAETYEAYRAEAERAAKAAGFFIDEQGNLMRLEWQEHAGNVEILAEANHILTESEFEAARVVDVTTGAHLRSRDALREAAQASSDAAIETAEHANQIREDTSALEAQKLELQAANTAMSNLRLVMTGEVGQASEEFEEGQLSLQEEIAGVTAELEELRAKHGQYVPAAEATTGSQDDLAIAMFEAAKRSDMLAFAQQNLGLNTDPSKQLELAAAFAVQNKKNDAAQAALAELSGEMVAGSGFTTDYSEDIGELEEKLGDLEDAYSENADEHDEATKRILINMLEQKLAMDGLEMDEVAALEELAEAWGLIDAPTLAALTRIGEMTEQFEAGELTRDELIGQMDGLAGVLVEDATPAVGDLETASADLDDELVGGVGATLPDVRDGMLEFKDAMSGEGGVEAAAGDLETAASSLDDELADRHLDLIEQSKERVTEYGAAMSDPDGTTVATVNLDTAASDLDDELEEGVLETLPDVTEALEDVTEAAEDATEALEEMPTEIEVEVTLVGFEEAIFQVGLLNSGLANIPRHITVEVEADIDDALLAESPSPLEESFRGITDALLEMQAATDVLDFGLGRVFGALGGTALDILQEREIDPLEEFLETFEEDIEMRQLLEQGAIEANVAKQIEGSAEIRDANISAMEERYALELARFQELMGEEQDGRNRLHADEERALQHEHDLEQQAIKDNYDEEVALFNDRIDEEKRGIRARNDIEREEREALLEDVEARQREGIRDINALEREALFALGDDQRAELQALDDQRIADLEEIARLSGIQISDLAELQEDDLKAILSAYEEAAAAAEAAGAADIAALGPTEQDLQTLIELRRELNDLRAAEAGFEEAQQNLKFLEQQADLIALITDNGLNAEEVLGDLELGVDASASAVLEAMTRALDAIIEKSQDELADMGFPIAGIPASAPGIPEATAAIQEELLPAGFIPFTPSAAEDVFGAPIPFTPSDPGAVYPPWSYTPSSAEDVFGSEEGPERRTTNQFNLTIYTSAPIEPIIEDFLMMRAAGGV